MLQHGGQRPWTAQHKHSMHCNSSRFPEVYLEATPAVIQQDAATKQQLSHPYQPLHEAHAEGRFRNVQLTTQLRLLDVELKHSQQQEATLRDQNTTLSSRCSELEQSLKEAQVSTSRSTARAADATDKMATSQQQLQQMQLDLAARDRKEQQLSSRVQQLLTAGWERDKALAASQGRAATAEGRVKDMQLTLAARDKEVHQLSTRVTQLSTTSKDRGDALAAARRRATSAEGQVSVLQGELNAKNKEVQELSERLQLLLATCSERTGALEVARGRVTTAEGQATAMQKQLGSLQQQHRQLQENQACLQNQVEVLSINKKTAAAVAASESRQAIQIRQYERQMSAMTTAMTAADEERQAAARSGMAARLVTANTVEQLHTQEQEVARLALVVYDLELQLRAAEERHDSDERYMQMQEDLMDLWINMHVDGQ